MSYEFGEPGKYTVTNGGTFSDAQSRDLFFQQTPQYVGTYWVGEVGRSIGFNLTTKPSSWHRFWMRVALGWTWKDDAP